MWRRITGAIGISSLQAVEEKPHKTTLGCLTKGGQLASLQLPWQQPHVTIMADVMLFCELVESLEVARSFTSFKLGRGRLRDQPVSAMAPISHP